MYEDFKKQNPNLQLSYEYFRLNMRKLTKKRTIKTGAADCRLDNIPSVLADRIFYKINYLNTYSVDEKPFNIRNLGINSAIVPKNFTGAIYKPVHNLKFIKPIYLIACITYKGIVFFALSNEPFTTISFNGFIEKLVGALPTHSQNSFLILDNAKFHQILPEIKDSMNQKNIFPSYTAPSTCFFDPIEEVFSIIQKRFTQLYHQKVIETGKYIPLNANSFKELVIEAVQSSNRDYTEIFRHAVL